MGAGQFIQSSRPPVLDSAPRGKSRGAAKKGGSHPGAGNSGMKGAPCTAPKSSNKIIRTGSKASAESGAEKIPPSAVSDQGKRLPTVGSTADASAGAPVKAVVDALDELHTAQAPYPGERDARLKRRITHQTGPVTEEGKAAVSSNAVKHGGYAVPTRGDASFVSIEQSITGRLQPLGEEQHSLVRSISYEVWRIGNIERTVVALERDIDNERVSLSQLAALLDFPFADSYREAMLTYRSEEALRQRVHGHLCGVFSKMLVNAEHLPKEAGPHRAEPNARAVSLIERARSILARPHLVQALEDDFFEEFDAVMLEARLGRSSLSPARTEDRHAGWMLPLVECWVYRNFRQIRITENKMMASLRLELLTSPGIERALRSATSRLGVLLSDYRDCCPDISIRSLQMLGYGPSRAPP